MPKLSLAKLERHLYSAADRLRQEGLDAATGRPWVRERVTLLGRRLGVKVTRVDVRGLGYRWGSCGKKGVVYFNWKLLQLPVRIIDYVIAHELAHLLEPHHGICTVGDS